MNRVDESAFNGGVRAVDVHFSVRVNGWTRRVTTENRTERRKALTKHTTGYLSR